MATTPPTTETTYNRRQALVVFGLNANFASPFAAHDFHDDGIEHDEASPRTISNLRPASRSSSYPPPPPPLLVLLPKLLVPGSLVFGCENRGGTLL